MRLKNYNIKLLRVITVSFFASKNYSRKKITKYRAVSSLIRLLLFAKLYPHRGTKKGGGGGSLQLATPPLGFCGVTIFGKYFTLNR